jgi:hypothetical protein
MSYRKVRFFFVSGASPIDSKSTVIMLKGIQPEDDDPEDDDNIYSFPENLQLPQHHEDLYKTAVGKSVKKSLVIRHKFANPIISLSEEMSKLYFDIEGNPTFDGLLLEPAAVRPPMQPKITATMVNPPNPVTKSLSTILKNAVVEKFSGKNQNANSWLENFEFECQRLDVAEDRYWEAIRLFLENSANDWYQSAKITFRNSGWETWRQSFLDSFSQKGWNECRLAYQFRYLNGFFSEYALQKLNLLVSLNKKIDEFTKIRLIVTGLPISVQERIDIAETTTVSKLLLKLNFLERSSRSSSMFSSFNSAFSKNVTRNPLESIRPRFCSYCQKKGFPGRNHTEADCRTKQNDLERLKNGQANVNKQYNFKTNAEKRTMNSTEMNESLKEIEFEQKNL